MFTLNHYYTDALETIRESCTRLKELSASDKAHERPSEDSNPAWRTPDSNAAGSRNASERTLLGKSVEQQLGSGTWVSVFSLSNEQRSAVSIPFLIEADI